jgi:hypothetical protein
MSIQQAHPPTDTTVAAMPPVTTDSGQIILRGRVKTPFDALNAFERMYNDDRWRSYDRALIQELLHDFPPQINGTSQEGKGSISNVNWGDASRKFLEACAPYMPLPFTNKTLFNLPLKAPTQEKDGTMAERDIWSGIIAEEATNTFRANERFLMNHIMNVANTMCDGVSFYMFEDPVSWMPRVYSMQQFKIPNQTKIGEIQFGGCEVPVYPAEIWEKIRDPESAKALGWNIEQARLAIMEACPGEDTYMMDWEKWELYWKNREIIMGDSDVQKSQWVYLWVRETDGTVSQYITRRDDSNEKFIFCCMGRFASMSQWIHPFIYTIPMKGTYHEIRGEGHRLYSKAQALNEKLNYFDTLTTFDSMPVLQPGSNAQAEEMEFETSGIFNILPIGWTFPDRKIPDYQNSLIPAIQMFRDMLNTSTSRPSINPTAETPKHLMDAYLMNQAQTSEVGEMLYYLASQGLYQEMLRRLTSEHYDPVMPGGVEAANFRLRCVERGVPEHVIYQIDLNRVEIVRVIGGGNASVKEMKLANMSQRAENLDPVGKNLFEHDLWAAALGEQAADKYCPVEDTERLPQDASIAQNENFILISGGVIQVLSGQNNEIHAQTHLIQLGMFNDQIGSGQVMLTDVVIPMKAVADHTAIHLSQAPQGSMRVRQMTAVLEQFQNMIENGLVQLKAQQEAAQREMEHNGTLGANGEQMQGPTPEERQAQATQQKLTGELMLQSAKIQAKLDEMQLKQKERASEMAFKDRQFAQKIAMDNAAAALKFRNQAMADQLKLQNAKRKSA